MEPSTSTVPEEQQATPNFMETENAVPPPAINDAMESAEVEPEDRSNQLFSFSDPRYWELPFLQGWLIGQSHAGQRMRRPPDSGAYENSSAFSEIENPAVMVPSVVPSRVGQSRVTSGSDSRHHSSHARMVPVTGSSEGVSSNNTTRIQTEIATSLTTTVAAAELPCTVRLRVWTHELKDACTPLDADRCRLTIPHAVLCRYRILLAKFVSLFVSTQFLIPKRSSLVSRCNEICLNLFGTSSFRNVGRANNLPALSC